MHNSVCMYYYFTTRIVDMSWNTEPNHPKLQPIFVVIIIIDESAMYMYMWVYYYLYVVSFSVSLYIYMYIHVHVHTCSSVQGIGIVS